ncbi:MAG: PAS domain-containing protein [Ferrovibrio sp.]
MPPQLFDQIASSWDIAALDVPLLRQVHDYWLSKRVGAALPLRSAIEPTEIPLLLPHLFLVEVLQPGPPMRLRMRLAGTAFRHFFGFDLTGQEMSEDDPRLDRAQFCAEWREVLERRAPRWARVRQQAGAAPVGQEEGITAIRFTGLVLPLSRDGTAADMLLGATVYDPVE